MQPNGRPRTLPTLNRGNVAGLSVLALLICWFGWNWFETMSHVLRYYNPIPVGDYWRVVEDFPSYSTFDIRCLWRQHNEHRIVFPEIVFAVDMLLFRGRQVLPIALSFSCYLTVFLLFARSFWQQAELSFRGRALGVLLAGAIAGWPLSSFVLGAPFLLQWTLLHLAVFVSLASLAELDRRFGPGWLTVLIAGGVVATFSSVNGLLLWPLLVVMSILLRWSRAKVAAVAIPAVLCTSLFFIGYERPDASLLQALAHPLYCFGFIVSYLSMPFGVIRNPLVGLGFGTVALGLWMFCFVRVFWNRTAPISPFTLTAFGYFAFVLLTAAMTSVGRLDLTNSGFLGAKASRYVTMPLLLWALLVQVVLELASREKWKRFSPRVILLITVLVIGFMQIRLGRWLRSNDDATANQQWATLGIENGMNDPRLLGMVFRSEAFVERYLPLLQSGGKSIYSFDEVQLLGHPLPSRFRMDRARSEPGGILQVTPMVGGTALFGWAAGLGRGGRRTILLVNQAGTIVGIGRHVFAGTPTPFPASSVQAGETWAGFVNSRYESTSITSYAANLDTGQISAVAKVSSFP